MRHVSRALRRWAATGSADPVEGVTGATWSRAGPSAGAALRGGVGCDFRTGDIGGGRRP